MTKFLDLGNPVNRQHGLNKGLVAWWLPLPNNVGGRTFFDLVTPRNNGTLTNMGSVETSGWKPISRQGAFASCPVFDSSNDYITCGTDSSLNVTNLAIAAWLRSAGSSGEPAIIGKGSYSGSGYHLIHSAGGGNANGVYLHVQGNFCLSTSTLNDSQWHHVVGTYDGATMRIYWDGKLENSTSVATTPNASGTSFEMGRRPGASPYYSGHIDDVSVRNIALTGDDVAAIYRESLLGYPTMLNRWSRSLVYNTNTGSPWYYNAQQAVSA